MKITEKTLQKNWVVCLVAMVCCFLWGSAFPCIKIGYSMFGIASDATGTQILFAGIRFMLAGILTVAFGSLLSHEFLFPKKDSWGMVLKLCMLQTVIQYIFFYIGLGNTAGVKASIIEASSVFVALLVSSLVFKFEKLGGGKILGCLVGFAGVVLINLNGTDLFGSMKFTGEGFVFFSTVSYAFSSVALKKYSKKENPVTLSGWQFLIGGLIMAVVGLVMGGCIHGFTPASTLLLLYLALISAVAYSLWGILLTYNPVGKVAVYGFMNPMFGVILSALLLGEKNQAFTWKGLLSLILVCVGIFIVNRQSGVKES